MAAGRKNFIFFLYPLDGMRFTVPDAQCWGAFPFPAIYFSLGKGLFIR